MACIYEEEIFTKQGQVTECGCPTCPYKNLEQCSEQQYDKTLYKGGTKMIHRTNHVADTVLAIIDGLSQEFDFTLEPYQNGREHGWALSNYRIGKKVAFAENRNSDDIVVYMGSENDFDMAGNMPNEATWKDAHYFRYDAHYNASTEIVRYLRGL